MMAAIVLWSATLIITIAQAVQIVTMIRVQTAAGVSLKSEAINSLAAGGLMVYAIHLTDSGLVLSRILLFALWLARLMTAWRYRPRLRL